MPNIFNIDRVALHLVDRNLYKPRFSKEEIDLKTFQGKDKKALDDFFTGHLEEVWKPPTDDRTRGANFKVVSRVKTYYDKLLENPDDFFQFSIEMAQLLYDLSKKRNTSPGLLMVLWFKKAGNEQDYLGLFKLDPGKTEIIFKQDEAHNVLLGLAVDHIAQALPEPGKRVLKWAVFPHTSNTEFDAKVKDKEGDPDPALYFMEFIGCEAKSSERKQVLDILNKIKRHAMESKGDVEGETVERKVVKELAKENRDITPIVVAEKVQSHSFFDGFRVQLEELPQDEIMISPDTLKNVKIQYKLSNGIIIKGRRAEIEAYVKIKRKNNQVEFKIRANHYDKSYV